MGIWQRRADSSSTISPSKNEHEIGTTFVAEEGITAHDGPHVDLYPELKARHVITIAVGGAIGTGLIIGPGMALAMAGPASILISYSIVGFVVYLVMCALGEMAAWLPLPSGFTGYAVRFCDPALGFTLGWTYWFYCTITTPNELTACALVITYWLDRTQVNPGVWITIFLVLIISINYFGIRFFQEFEFWLSSFKVLVILGLILLSLVLVLGGGPDHDRKGFRYWNNPGAFNTYIATGAAGRFYALWTTMVSATFTYLGTELTIGEAQNPRKTIPRAIKLIFYRILALYILSVLLIGMLVPYTFFRLNFTADTPDVSRTGAASAFVVAIQLAGVTALPDIINACILVFVLSASNSNLYIATRTIYGLAREGKAPRIIARKNRRGVPIYALGLSSLFCLLAYMNVSSNSTVVFGYFINLVTIFGLLTWISILVTHLYFIRARKAQHVPESKLAYKAPFGAPGSWVALIFCIIIALTKNFDVFTHSSDVFFNFDYRNFITSYLGIPLYLMLIFGYKVIMKSKGVKPHEADLWTGKDAIDREEAEYEARKAAETKHQQRNWVYNIFVSWLF
ncbi:hypothetical protein DTO271G3_77 [Paecilomyces variotii]|nr:hypothetical protein DTO271G3_77 [Paecilomyces variotii]